MRQRSRVTIGAPDFPNVTIGAPGDKRRVKRTLRRQGFRVNPTARRGSFVVRAKQPGGAFQQIAAFVSKPQAINYAKALARSNPRATIAVHGRGAIIDRRFD